MKIILPTIPRDYKCFGKDNPADVVNTSRAFYLLDPEEGSLLVPIFRESFSQFVKRYGLGFAAIKNQIDDIRGQIDQTERPEGYDLLYDMGTQRAAEEYLFMRYSVMRQRCYIFYTYVWKRDKWYFRRLDGSGDIPLTDAIAQGIED